MNHLSFAISLTAILFPFAVAQGPKVPAPNVQIATALLPLPDNMRSGAGVLGYGPTLSLVSLRPSTNGMVCIATRPGDDTFDVRCYQQAFLPIVRRIRELGEHGKSEDEISRVVDSEIKARKLILPNHPTAGYRMLGPISAYSAANNTVGNGIESWQSIHFPYNTAAEIGLPEEGTVARTMPYVMASGTFWCHVMIEHGEAPGQAQK